LNQAENFLEDSRGIGLCWGNISGESVSWRTYDIGQNKLYEFFYVFRFDLWTFYLARILFLQECGSLFWEFPSSIRIFNELQYNLQMWQGFINVSESFTRKERLVVFNDRLIIFIIFFHVLILCFSARIQGLFGSRYGIFSLRFLSQFWVDLIYIHIRGPLKLIVQELLKLMKPKFRQPLMNITSKFFSFNVWEWFLHSSVLERTESDLSKINWLCGVILLHSNSVGVLGRFTLCHTLIRSILVF